MADEERHGAVASEERTRELAYREQVMGVVGHDLRSPLAAVRALVTLLLRRDDLPEPVRRSLEEIDRAGRRMLEMTALLLDFTEGRFTGHLPIAPAPADLHEVCRGVVEELRAAAPGRTIALHLAGDGRGEWDAARLAQVVSNLVGNALEHGGRDGPVRVSVRGVGREVVLTVEDPGPGIAPEILPVLFEPFRRGARAGGSVHAGLGLYIVRQIVDAHGGEIAVRSSPRRGATFTVRLPRAARRGIS